MYVCMCMCFACGNAQVTGCSNQEWGVCVVYKKACRLEWVVCVVYKNACRPEWVVCCV